MTSPIAAVRRAAAAYSQSFFPGMGGGTTPPGDPAPTLATVSPDVQQVGTDGPLTATGTGYVAGSVVVVDGADQVTTFLSSIMVTFMHTPVTAGTRAVTVRNPDGQVSGSVTLTVVELADRPVLNSIVPTTAPVGPTPVTVQFLGSDFIDGAEVIRGGSVAMPATFVSATELTAAVDVSLAGTLNFQVRNPGDPRLSAGSSEFIITPVVEDELDNTPPWESPPRPDPRKRKGTQ